MRRCHCIPPSRIGGRTLARFALAVLVGVIALGAASPPVFANAKGNPNARKDESKWIEVHSTNFSVLTDAGEKRGREVALRMEQMRTVFGELLLKNKLKMPVPITVIALKSDKQYGAVAPEKLSFARGFYVPDRIGFTSF